MPKDIDDFLGVDMGIKNIAWALSDLRLKIEYKAQLHGLRLR
jgi:transposase